MEPKPVPLADLNNDVFKAKTLIYLNQVIDLLVTTSKTQEELKSLQHILEGFIDVVKKERLSHFRNPPSKYQ